MTTKMRYNEQQVLGMMYDYQWSVRVLQEKRSSLESIFVQTAKYGIETSMPKAQGHVNDAVYNEVLRRERATKSLNSVREKVLFLQNFLETDEYEDMDFHNKMILNMTLEGMTIRAIGRILELHHNTVHRRQQAIARIIANCAC